MTHGSLFSGIGGFDLGFQMAGIKTLWQVECDELCNAVLAKHWPMARRFRDVRALNTANLEQVDIISGGFPCQDISNAGRRAGIEGKRSGLWRDMHRVVSDLRPRFVVVENVAALRSRGMGRVLGDLAKIGYDAEWSVVSACSLGAPHTRERMFILAYPRSEWRQQCSRIERQENSGAKRHVCHWKHKPEPPRVANGIPRRMDRLRALGNAIVPEIAEWIGRRVVEM